MVATLLTLAMLITTIASYSYAQRSKVARRSEEAKDLTIRRQLMRAQNELGLAKSAAGDYATAYEAFNQSLAAAQDLWKGESELPGGPTANTRLMLAETNANLGKVLLESGAAQGALDRLTKARDYYQHILVNANADNSADVRQAQQALIRLMKKASATAGGQAGTTTALPPK